jgi:hypothetical protein
MSTAETATIAEIIEEHAAQEGTAVYYSKSSNLRLVRRPIIITETQMGTRQVAQQPLRYEFGPNGHLVVREGQDVLPDGPGGEMQDAIAWLASHPSLNEWFWRDGHEPDRALPTERDFLSTVQRALVARDVEQLKTLLVQEQGTHNRRVLMDAAISAIETLRDAGEDVGDLTAPPAPVVTYSAEVAAMDRSQLAETLIGLGLEVPADASDDQLRGALVAALEG